MVARKAGSINFPCTHIHWKNVSLGNPAWSLDNTANLNKVWVYIHTLGCKLPLAKVKDYDISRPIKCTKCEKRKISLWHVFIGGNLQIDGSKKHTQPPEKFGLPLNHCFLLWDILYDSIQANKVAINSLFWFTSVLR